MSYWYVTFSDGSGVGVIGMNQENDWFSFSHAHEYIQDHLGRKILITAWQPLSEVEYNDFCELMENRDGDLRPKLQIIKGDE